MLRGKDYTIYDSIVLTTMYFPPIVDNVHPHTHPYPLEQFVPMQHYTPLTCISAAGGKLYSVLGDLLSEYCTLLPLDHVTIT